MNDVQYLPDQVLAQAIQSPNGSIPGFVALAELQRRQKLRQTGAAQAPNSTVAQQVLQGVQGSGQSGGMNTIDSLPVAKGPQQPPAGIAGLAQQPTPQQQPQQQQAPAPGMRRGGIVKKMAKGGTASEDQDPQSTDPWMMLTPPPVDIDRPDLTTYDQAVANTRKAYGPGPDYSEEIGGIRRLRDAQLPMTNQQTLFRAALALMGTPGNASQAFSSATLGALGAQQQSRQDAFNNQMRADQALSSIKDRSQDRNDHVVDASRSFMEADNNAKIAQYHWDVSAAHQAAQEKANAFKDFMGALKSPDEAAALASAMDARLNQGGMSSADTQRALTTRSMALAAKQTMLDKINEQQNAELNRQKEFAKTQFGYQQALLSQREAGENHRAELAHGVGMQNQAEAIQALIDQNADTTAGGVAYINRDQLLKGVPKNMQTGVLTAVQSGGYKLLSAPDVAALRGVDAAQRQIDQSFDTYIENAGKYGNKASRWIGTQYHEVAGDIPDMEAQDKNYLAAIDTLKGIAAGAGSNIRINLPEIDMMLRQKGTIANNTNELVSHKKIIDQMLNEKRNQILRQVSISRPGGTPPPPGVNPPVPQPTPGTAPPPGGRPSLDDLLGGAR